MIKSRKQMYLVIGVFSLVLLLGTVTYAFFNYTRTGTANVIKTGRIYFNSEQGTAINLTNVFPVDVSNGIPSNNDNVGSVTINVTGDTTYDDGVEYLVSAVNVQNTVGNKSLPISIDVSYEANGNGKEIGTEDEEYFDNRGGNSSVYKVLAKNTISSNDQLVVGYIAKGQTGIDGNIIIKAYIDESKIAISDTYPEQTIRIVKTTGYSSSNCENALTGVYNASTYCATASSLQSTIDNNYLSTAQISSLVNAGIVEETTDGTTSSWVNGRTVFTTTEWNSLQANGVSFQIKVEANEGIWVEEQLSVNAMDTLPQAIKNECNSIKEVYFNRMNEDAMHNAYNAATVKADITSNNEGEVLTWLETNETDNTMYTLYIASTGTTFLTTGRLLFQYFTNMDTIEFNNIDTSRVTDMYMMFAWTYKLSNIDLSSFDTSNVEDMSFMFWYNGLTSLDIRDFDMKKVRNLTQFVSHSNTIQSFNMAGQTLSSVTDMSNMFYGNENMITVDLSDVKTPLVTTMYQMFYDCNSITEISLSGMGSDNLSDMSSMFSQTNKLENIDMSYFNFGSSSLVHFFGESNKVKVVDLSYANFSNVSSMTALFASDSLLTTIYASDDWNIDSSIPTNSMFSGCSSLVGGNGTVYDNTKVDRTMAVIDTPSTPGYLTNIVDKPSS